MNLFSIKSAMFALTALFTIALFSCKKEDPHHNHDNEEYDKLTISLVAYDSLGNTGVDTLKVEFDAHGVQSPSVLSVSGGQKYLMLIDLYSHEHSINQEIIEDASAHQFFFFAQPDSFIEHYEYADAQIGLKGKVRFAAASSAPVQVIMRHGLNKNHAAAQTYNSANFQEAGGSNDLNITVNIAAQ